MYNKKYGGIKMANKKIKLNDKVKTKKKREIKEISIDGLQKNITRCGRSRWWDHQHQRCDTLCDKTSTDLK